MRCARAFALSAHGLRRLRTFPMPATASRIIVATRSRRCDARSKSSAAAACTARTTKRQAPRAARRRTLAAPWTRPSPTIHERVPRPSIVFVEPLRGPRRPRSGRFPLVTQRRRRRFTFRHRVLQSEAPLLQLLGGRVQVLSSLSDVSLEQCSILSAARAHSLDAPRALF